jgi:putative transposase
MPYINIWIHFVWATKNRASLLTKNIRQDVFKHIKDNGSLKNIHIDFVNGYVEHVHCLVSLNQKQTIAEVAQLMKGESSYWINKHKLTPEKFEWQDEYFAVSVSEKDVNKVREYIKNQEEHHSKTTFAQEYDLFMKKYGFRLMKDL